MKATDEAPPPQHPRREVAATDDDANVQALCSFMRWSRCVAVGHLRLAAAQPQARLALGKAPRFAWRQPAYEQAAVHLQALYGSDNASDKGSIVDQLTPADQSWLDWQSWAGTWLDSLARSDRSLYERVGEQLQTDDTALRAFAYAANRLGKTREYRLLLAHLALWQQEKGEPKKTQELQLLRKLLGNARVHDQPTAENTDEDLGRLERFDVAQRELIEHLQARSYKAPRLPALDDLLARAGTAKSRNALRLAADRVLAAMEQQGGDWCKRALAMRALGPRQRELLFIDALQALCERPLRTLPEVAMRIEQLAEAARTVAKSIREGGERALASPTSHDIAAHLAWRRAPGGGTLLGEKDSLAYFLRVFGDSQGLTVDKRRKGDGDKERRIYAPIRRLLLTQDRQPWAATAQALAAALHGDNAATRTLAALDDLPTTHPLSLHGTRPPLHVIPASDLASEADAVKLEMVRQLALAAADAAADPLYRLDDLVPTDLKPRPRRHVRHHSNWYELALALQPLKKSLQGDGLLVDVLRSAPDEESVFDLAQRMNAAFSQLLDARLEKARKLVEIDGKRLQSKDVAEIERALFADEVKATCAANGLSLRANHLNILAQYFYDDLDYDEQVGMTPGSRPHRLWEALVDLNAFRLARRFLAQAPRWAQIDAAGFKLRAGSAAVTGHQDMRKVAERLARAQHQPLLDEQRVDLAAVQAELATVLRNAGKHAGVLLAAMRADPLFAPLFVAGLGSIEHRGAQNVER